MQASAARGRGYRSAPGSVRRRGALRRVRVATAEHRERRIDAMRSHALPIRVPNAEHESFENFRGLNWIQFQQEVKLQYLLLSAL